VRAHGVDPPGGRPAARASGGSRVGGDGPIVHRDHNHPEGELTMREYPKIYGPYKRHTEGPDRNKLIEGEWTNPVLEHLQHTTWLFAEKVDGTNIRVHWDGHKVTFGGRTDRAQIPAKLIQALIEMF